MRGIPTRRLPRFLSVLLSFVSVRPITGSPSLRALSMHRPIKLLLRWPKIARLSLGALVACGSPEEPVLEAPEASFDPGYDEEQPEWLEPEAGALGVFRMTLGEGGVHHLA